MESIHSSVVRTHGQWSESSRKVCKLDENALNPLTNPITQPSLNLMRSCFSFETKQNIFPRIFRLSWFQRPAKRKRVSSCDVIKCWTEITWNVEFIWRFPFYAPYTSHGRHGMNDFVVATAASEVECNMRAVVVFQQTEHKIWCSIPALRNVSKCLFEMPFKIIKISWNGKFIGKRVTRAVCSGAEWSWWLWVHMKHCVDYIMFRAV